MRSVVLSLFLCALAPALAPAAEEAGLKKWSALKTWFKHLKEGLADSAVSGQYQKGKVTAVAAVRGSPQDAVDPKKPSWKGSSQSKKAQELRKEKSELGKAVDLILEERFSEAEESLAAFEKAHPKSSLLAEAKEARAKLSELKDAVPASSRDAAAPASSPGPAAPSAPPGQEGR